MLSLKDFLKDYRPKGHLDKLSFGHYFYQERLHRLDLISNEMLGVSVRVGQKNYMLGDVSEKGFSYAQEVPKIHNMTQAKIRRKINEVAEKNQGRIFPFSLFFLGDSITPALDTKGRVVNHQLFVGLSHQEIEREIGSVLYKKGVKRGQDPNQHYDKMEAMLRRAFKIGHRRKWDRVSLVAMNVAFLNLIGEIGAPPEQFERLIDDYPGRILFVKYGVSLEDETDALQLFSFAKYRDANFLIREREKRAERILAKQAFFTLLNQQYDARAFLEKVWNKALSYYELTQRIPFPHPTNREDSEHFTAQLKAASGQIERVADNDYRGDPEPNEFELFLSEALYWNLIDKDKKYLDRSLIVAELQGIMASCFMEAMAEVGWKENETAPEK
ncbi:MAG: hypothetical protein A2600_01710 [Candidatus Lambdaproteobacteria bacterium RIFOXYD1_FULL_56_27]|uniref:Uncharacterized protein n=1 Tax=Candidatus Lambdaproteobacteria bacterium RIFOXYD2_FULL_56_26 TaxID=1817773 RepID=A0A1F6GMZ6_9PROT|nr:MAG: hypothetical protein A2557_12720 [Candidatus Lambdaproteobacteria bacterium RIFOXYD2_FULL_56_26]OGH05561.1 MAG: hypothetical protein A2426_04500 [Candidatus Lambdaproteobacteria bacterium RIFOXYC1_FULL_56_13]OGH08520.1 MAG: hypothetical protein A2600_01710 [Candidatus Lambdaproteobacteria bacterium RIFOXYD1_FULL_56_27]